jgi:hypothetical protein
MKNIFTVVLILAAISFAAMNSNAPTAASTQGFYTWARDTLLGQSDTVKGTGTAKCTLSVVTKRPFATGFEYFIAYGGVTEVTGSTDSVKIMWKVYNYDVDGNLINITANDSMSTGAGAVTNLLIGSVNLGATQTIKAWAYATHTVAGAYFTKLQIIKRRFVQIQKQWN